MKLTTLKILLVVFVLSNAASSLYGDSPAERLLKKPDAWFSSAEGQKTLDSVLAWQTEHGDWPKNTDTTRERPANEGRQHGTFDNHSTTGELRLLARAYRVTSEASYRVAFLKGFEHILEAQYPNGGWPQYYPLSTKYHRHITFNDDTMIRLMKFLDDVAIQEDFQFLGETGRRAAAAAVEKGIDCILACQVQVDGQATVWCAQHHAQTLVPVLARSYEHPSLSGAESAGILIYLMELESPSPEVRRAIESGVQWFRSAKIEGYRYRKSKSEKALVADSEARPLWARFYEIESNRPIFSDRDGVIKYDIEEIGAERRGGYSWYGNWGEKVLKAHGRWRERITGT